VQNREALAGLPRAGAAEGGQRRQPGGAVAQVRGRRRPDPAAAAQGAGARPPARGRQLPRRLAMRRLRQLRRGPFGGRRRGAGLVKDGSRQGLPLRTVDIGGGFPIRQTPSEHNTLLTFGARMRHDLDRLFPRDIDLIAEPGRALVGTAGLLITRVVGRSIRNNKNYYYLDDGLYGDFSGILFDHSRFEFRTLKKTPQYLSVLAGPTCDSIDTIATSGELPERGVGGVVSVPNTGAYGCASPMPSSGTPPARVIVV